MTKPLDFQKNNELSLSKFIESVKNSPNVPLNDSNLLIAQVNKMRELMVNPLKKTR